MEPNYNQPNDPANNTLKPETPDDSSVSSIDEGQASASTETQPDVVVSTDSTVSPEAPAAEAATNGAVITEAVPPATPAPAPGPIVQTSPDQTQTIEGPAPVIPVKKRSLAPLFIVLAVLAGLFVIGVVLFVLLLWPNIQKQAYANLFMSKVTAGDTDGALELAGGDEADRSFIQGAAEALKGNTYESEESLPSGKDYYALYSLTGGENKYARVVVSKNDSGAVITGFVFSKSKLSIKPGSSSQSQLPESTESTTSAPTSSPTASKCLEASDVMTLSSTNTTPYSDGRFVHIDNFFFLADSTAYEYADGMVDKLAKYKRFATTASGKDYTVTIIGSVNSAAPAASLANQRAEKAKSDLIAQGIPADKIKIGEPRNVGNYEIDPSAMRNVDIEIKSSDACKTN